MSEAMKTEIEALEPGVHQFWPLAIKRKNAYPGSYFGFVCGQWIDTFYRAEGNPESWLEDTGLA
ncbi:hypothetical protein [Sulfitobacter geojensis]|uniref:Uncharacterized protein n=1 Tax=Sulfitobacter geojensis TaxID=1342299 RepID=A0AAE3B816_9RHOB|nr:hypothetical protein [Sulfitobacter geojensis]MBM1690689.1 hypothetical protein [Sulfitobacter geojensis]MBM1694755.1 hypothetical protein [Sulfitobacter geojensis]MBM1707539.1 hypothetical protein [Sulfitobacter geojensis]MBM1711149.1 hypothetical protein [Sulfitobacter geojensis]MBM1715664.1 hypothetical protein [Sulfitobacter geojensis]